MENDQRTYPSSHQKVNVDGIKPKNKILNKKTNRNEEPLFEIKDKKCDFCLSNICFQENLLLECHECSGITHLNCMAKYQRGLSEGTAKNWICSRCSEAKSQNRTIDSYL
jgi:hypothetical protein